MNAANSENNGPNKGRSLLILYGPLVLLVIAGFVFAYQFVDPAPPDRLVLATGDPAGAYSRFGERYRRFFADRGIELELRYTEGSLANLELLVEPGSGVRAAFVQGGTAGAFADRGLNSLGSLYYEPVWLFYRGISPVRQLSDLAGKRVAIGAPGSGTRALVGLLLEDNALTGEDIELLEVGGGKAASRLRAGDIDAAFFVAGATSPTVRELATTDGIQLMGFERVTAYTKLHNFLSEVVLPQGVLDLADNVPTEDLRLPAAATNLVVAEDIHPVFIDLLLQAAAAIHAEPSWFHEEFAFPAPKRLVLPIHKEATRFYKYGPPLLQRYLPFWAASLIDRLKVMLLPVIVLLVPLVRMMPPLYNWRMRSRIFRWYRELERVASLASRELNESERRRQLRRLSRIEEDVSRVHVPLGFMAHAYDLRMHIGLIRDKLSDKDTPSTN